MDAYETDGNLFKNIGVRLANSRAQSDSSDRRADESSGGVPLELSRSALPMIRFFGICIALLYCVQRPLSKWLGVAFLFKFALINTSA